MTSKKSFIAKIAESILKFTKPKYMNSNKEVNDFLAKQAKKTDKHVRSIFKSTYFNEMQVFTYGKKESENMVLYIHGGAYIGQINMQHHLFCFMLSRKLNVRVISPVYPLAPNHKASESFDLIVDLYKHLLKNHKNITIMGDSAGGGLALAFCQCLNKLKLPQPKQIITFSPWVDITMSNTPYDNEDDPILGEIGLREIGKSWAGDLDTKDYKVSPLYGDNPNQPKTLIFAGTNEIFYKDIAKYTEKLKNNDVDFELITGEGMFHIYPLFPVPEAKKAFKEIRKMME